MRSRTFWGIVVIYLSVSHTCSARKYTVKFGNSACFSHLLMTDVMIPICFGERSFSKLRRKKNIQYIIFI